MSPQSVTGDGAGVRPGRPLPLGATLTAAGVRFSVFSRHARSVRVLLFDEPEGEPTRVVEMPPDRHRSGDIWHVEIDGLGPGQLYGFSADGPHDPARGHRFDPDRLLLDPYARALTADFPWQLGPVRVGASAEGRPTFELSGPAMGHTPKCIVTGDRFDWGEDRHPRIPLEDSILYELHVRGFTRHPSARVAHPGTYRGLIERIPYLRDLGVTAVELMPIQEFDELEIRRVNPLSGERLRNFWGYGPLGHFAPKGTYAADGGRGRQVAEFKSLVKALHAAGLEVILDVVFNHTGEGGPIGPTLHFRGLDNRIYYLLDEKTRDYLDHSGCGNTVNCNHPVVQEFIMDCLRYWVAEMHVDGFRFDLASILARGADGRLLERPPLVERIAEDALLRDTKIIAEAWDAGGAYQVGSFATGRWAEWNGRYRDDVRRYWRGDPGLIPSLATRIAGSSDLYGPSGRGPGQSINYVTSHDGFTVHDLVSYGRRHNEANGEWNRDGDGHEVSWNNGVEGETGDRVVNARRRRQVKSLLATLFVSQGVPMLLAGDEFHRTQRGNNNAYCQDNETSWIDWTALEREAELHRFVRGLIAFRKRHPALRRRTFFAASPADGGPRDPDVRWTGPDGEPIAWAARGSSLGCLIDGGRARTGAEVDDDDLLLLFHNGETAVEWRLPAPPRGGSWRRAIDTARAAPDDLPSSGQSSDVGDAEILTVEAGSVVVLVATAP